MVHSNRFRRQPVGMRLLSDWYQIGGVRFLQTFLAKYGSELRQQSGPDDIDQIQRFELLVLAATEFERVHGDGSFLNTNHKYVKDIISTGSQVFDESELKNAQMAKEERARLFPDILLARSSANSFAMVMPV